MKRYNENNINTKEHWDNIYEDFSFDSLETYKHIIKHIPKEDATVVDLGCGDGSGMEVAHNWHPGLNIIGVDFSSIGIKKAKKRYPWGEWICGDATHSGLEDRCARYVVSSETLEHLEAPEKLIQEAYRLLVDDGVLLLTTPYDDHIPSDEHLWSFHYSDIEKMVKDAGFRTWFVFPYASGRFVWHTVNGVKQIKYPSGNWDEIMVLATK